MTIEHTGTWAKTVSATTFNESIEVLVAEGDGEYFISFVVTVSGKGNEDYILIQPMVGGRQYSDQPEFYVFPSNGDNSGETTVVLAGGEQLYLVLDGYVYGQVSFTVNWTVLAPSFGIPVTPQDPTFLDEEPWVVLPVQDHITYSVSGTPGWNSSVTVTATADEGYVISGQSSWTKEWGAKPLPPNALIQDDIDMVYFGNQWAEALYKGGMVVWEFVTPRITTFSLAEMVEGQYFSTQINTNFEVVSWSAEGLPAGLSLSQSGLLSGTPAAESSGVVTITANGIGPRTAQESYMWSVGIPVLPTESIRASGVNKTSHSGWARPNVTWTVNGGSPQYASNGTLYMKRGRGRVRASVTLNSARQGRIVSNLNGVLATSSSSTGWQINSGSRAFQAGEQIYLELNGYSGSSNDRLYLYVEP